MGSSCCCTWGNNVNSQAQEIKNDTGNLHQEANNGLQRVEEKAHIKSAQNEQPDSENFKEQNARSTNYQSQVLFFGYCLKCNDKQEQNSMQPEIDYGIDDEKNNKETVFDKKIKCSKCKLYLCDEETKKGILEEKYNKQLKKLKLNIQTLKYELKKCQKQNCKFTYIYDQNKNENFHDDRQCLCSKLSPQSTFQFSEINNSQPFAQVSEAFITCQYCQHQQHYETLKQKVLSDLSYKCICGENYNDKLFHKINENEFKQFKNILFRRQLRALKNKVFDLQIVQCQQNCGHFWFNDANFIVQPIKCQCGALQKGVKNKCFHCDQNIFKKSIAFFACDHVYHITCALQIIQPDRFESKCKCQSKLIDIDFERLGILCKVCKKSNGNLTPLQCKHYIHQTCYAKQGLRLNNFPCCQESIQELVKKNVQGFHDIIIQENCHKCNQKGEDLIKLDCDHWYDKKCFNMLLDKIAKGGSNSCICKKAISIDILVSVD